MHAGRMAVGAVIQVPGFSGQATSPSGQPLLIRPGQSLAAEIVKPGSDGALRIAGRTLQAQIPPGLEAGTKLALTVKDATPARVVLETAHPGQANPQGARQEAAAKLVSQLLTAKDGRDVQANMQLLSAMKDSGAQKAGTYSPAKADQPSAGQGAAAQAKPASASLSQPAQPHAAAQAKPAAGAAARPGAQPAPVQSQAAAAQAKPKDFPPHLQRPEAGRPSAQPAAGGRDSAPAPAHAGRPAAPGASPHAAAGAPGHPHPARPADAAAPARPGAEAVHGQPLTAAGGQAPASRHVPGDHARPEAARAADVLPSSQAQAQAQDTAAASPAAEGAAAAAAPAAEAPAPAGAQAPAAPAGAAYAFDLPGGRAVQVHAEGGGGGEGREASQARLVVHSRTLGPIEMSLWMDDRSLRVSVNVDDASRGGLADGIGALPGKLQARTGRPSHAMIASRAPDAPRPVNPDGFQAHA